MKLILLSGGSGKRLWPLSNDSRSKQFLKVLKNEKNERESMIQRVWRQLSNAGLQKSVYITTSTSQVDMIRSQLGDEVPIITEPNRRDTFPAIALACTFLYSVEGIQRDEVIVVLPVDPYVEDHFFKRIQDLENVLWKSSAKLALMGVKPTYPAEKYGYIVPQKEKERGQNSGYERVNHFIEKPHESLAKELVEQGALWNCGVFAFKLDFIISFLQQKGLPIQYDELLKQYDRLPKNSFDYEVVEKTDQIVAVTYEGYWKDIGTWNTLTEEMDAVLIGKGMMSADCVNTHVINELDIPVTVLGLSNAIIAASPDGILVSDKSSSHKVKDLLKSFEQRPMYEERRWGWYKVLDYTRLKEGKEVLTKRIRIFAGKNLSYQIHFKRNEVWTMISGEGEFVLNEELSRVKAGDILEIPAGAKHAIKALTDLEFIEVQSGSELIEEDIIRIYMDWEEIVHHCAQTSK